MSNDTGSVNNNALEPAAEPGEQDHSGSTSPLPFREYSYLVLLIIGVAMLGLYLMYFLNSISLGFTAVVYNQGFIYAVIGVAVVLMALHIRNRASSNKTMLPVAVFCGLNAMFLFVSLIIIVATRGFSRSSMVGQYQLGNMVLAVLEILSFIALILVEMPAARRALASRFREEEAEDEVEEYFQAD